ncbi:PAS domain-containing sensor histidine kinase [Rubripirellula amarantea]|nr:PAS domain-containing sensor histidine kinase [Rubripirellula amarantea]
MSETQTRTASIRQNGLASRLLELSPAAVLITNLLGEIQWVNRVTLTWFGYSEAELQEKVVDVLFSSHIASDAGAHQACPLSHFGQRSGEYDGKQWDLVGRRKNGSIFPVRFTSHRLSKTLDEIVFFGEMNFPLKDADLAKRIEDERLSAVLEMVSGLAHGCRNAMQRAQSCLALIELDLPKESSSLQLTDRVRAALADLHKNYEEAKSYASPITLRRSDVDLAKLCGDTMTELSIELAQYSMQLKVECDSVCQRAYVDQARMQQVFYHLLKNAIQASPELALIRCDFHASTAPSGEGLELRIRDYGSGIGEDIAKRAFEPFFTTKQQGTGLGLSLCRRIVAAHGGTIDFVCHYDVGSEVLVQLPSMRNES